MDIRDKIALVLGSSKGIGREIARTLADKGAKVILPYHHDRPEDDGELKKAIDELDQGHLVGPVDLRYKDQV